MTGALGDSMRVCSSGVVMAAAAALLGATLGAGAPPAEITGTVKVTGLASSADVVVYVQDVKGGAAPTKPLAMDQSKMQFVPHVLAVPAGASVKFLNDDPTPHKWEGYDAIAQSRDAAEYIRDHAKADSPLIVKPSEPQIP